MAYRSIFGDDLTEYEIDIVTQTGLAQAQWEAIDRQTRLYNQHHSQRATRYKLIQLLKGLGVVGSTAVALGKAWYNAQTAKQDPGLQGPEGRPAKKIRAGDAHITSKSTTEEEDRKRKVPTPTTPKQVKTVSVSAGGDIEPAKKFEAKPNTLWEDHTLRNRDRNWLHEANQKAAMADVEMSGPDGQTNTDQVTPVSRFSNAFEGIPRQYTTILPYMASFTNGTVSTAAGSQSTTIYLRMNSVYDIRKSDGNTYSADPAVAADTADAGTKEKPMWRDYWMQFYEYWTVVECRYKISGYITNDSAAFQMGVMHGYVGLQKPPIVSAGTTDLTYDEYKHWKGFKIQTAQSALAANQLNLKNGPNTFEITGVYHPGDGTHEVAEDELVQTWVKGDNVPKEQNLLMVRWFFMPWSSKSAQVTFNYRIDLEYVVQFKDQKAIWQFPHTGVTSVATSIAGV